MGRIRPRREADMTLDRRWGQNGRRNGVMKIRGSGSMRFAVRDGM